MEHITLEDIRQAEREYNRRDDFQLRTTLDDEPNYYDEDMLEYELSIMEISSYSYIQVKKLKTEGTIQ